MIVFRHHLERRAVSSLWQECEHAATHSSQHTAPGRLQAFLTFTQMECALADHWNPESDDLDERRRPFLAASLTAAAQILHPAAVNWGETLTQLSSLLPPEQTTVSLSPWEGMRFYALFPERYEQPALQWRRAHPNQMAWVIGLRSIGSALGAVVAATLRREGVPVGWMTVRPRGAPQDRQCCATTRLEAELKRWPGHFLLVDEGPGLSGTSLGGAIAWLLALGIPRERVALFPSWAPSRLDLPSPRIADLWDRVERYPARPLQPPAPHLADISAGRWRDLFPWHTGVPVWPQHERVKYADPLHGRILKFLGLGRAAAAALERARELAAAGFTPAVTGSDNGWIYYRRIAATPLSRRPCDMRIFAHHAGEYLAFLARRFPLGPAQPPTPELQEMVRVNLDRLGRVEPPLPPEGIPVALDARMLPHEWGQTEAGWIKFDAIDHCDDPFFPGPCDIAWDLATVEVEFGAATAAAVRRAIQRRGAGDDPAPRLQWYRAAYCAFRIAFCRLAATQTETPDTERFTALARRYERRLGQEAPTTTPRRFLLPPHSPQSR